MSGHLPSRRRFTTWPAVVSVVALVVALSAGSAAVATHLVVRSSDIVDGQVKTMDLADDAVTGAKVAEETLGQVPDAAELDGLRGDSFYLNTEATSTPRVLTRMSGFEISVQCVQDLETGDHFPQLTARTKLDNARLRLAFTGFSFADLVVEEDFDTGEGIDLDLGRNYGAGTVLMTNPFGQTVSVDYSFVGNVRCWTNGVALGG